MSIDGGWWMYLEGVPFEPKPRVHLTIKGGSVRLGDKADACGSASLEDDRLTIMHPDGSPWISGAAYHIDGEVVTFNAVLHEGEHDEPPHLVREQPTGFWSRVRGCVAA